MNDIDKIIKKIMLDNTFEPLREKYIIDLKYRNDNSVVFDLLTSNFKPNKHYFMKAEILHVVDNINDESAEILDYKILKINQRIRLNNDLNVNTDYMIKYVSNSYSIKLLAMNDEYQRIIYYLLYIYESIESLAQLADTRELSYSTEDAVKNILSICNAVNECHKVNICHNDIVPENIFVSYDCDYKIGKIDMKNFLNFTDTSHPSYDLSITNELSVQNDIYMLGKVIKFIAENATRKNQLLHSKLIKISEKACKKKYGYRNVNEIISDLQKPHSNYIKFIIPVAVLIIVVLTGAGIFSFRYFAGKNISGDINGDGRINQADVFELQDIYSNLSTMDKEFTVQEKAKYDINADGYIDMRDVSLLMDYISYMQENNTDMTMQEFIELRQNE